MCQEPTPLPGVNLMNIGDEGLPPTPGHQPGRRRHRNGPAAFLRSTLSSGLHWEGHPGPLCAPAPSSATNRVLSGMRRYRATLSFVVSESVLGCCPAVTLRFAWIFTCFSEPGDTSEGPQAV